MSPANTYAKGDIKLKVKEDVEEDSDHQEDEHEDNYGEIRYTYTDSESERVTMSVAAKNTSDVEITCDLECFIITEDAKTEEKGVYKFMTKSVTIPAKGTVVETFEGVNMAVKTVTRDYGNYDDQISGQTYEGYVVMAVDKGRLLGKDANTGRYLKEEWLQLCARKKRESTKK